MLLQPRTTRAFGLVEAVVVVVVLAVLAALAMPSLRALQTRGRDTAAEAALTAFSQSAVAQNAFRRGPMRVGDFETAARGASGPDAKGDVRRWSVASTGSTGYGKVSLGVGTGGDVAGVAMASSPSRCTLVRIGTDGNGDAWSRTAANENCTGRLALLGSAHQDESAGQLAAPTGLVATASDGKVALTWNGVVGATRYTVYQDGAAVATVDQLQTVVTGLVNGTTYTFAVSATDHIGEGRRSTDVLATPLPAPPSAPTLSGSAGDTAAHLSWTSVTGAAGYRVYRNGVALTPDVAGTSTSTTVTGLTNGTTYRFEVRTVDAYGQTSPASNTVEITPVPPA